MLSDNATIREAGGRLFGQGSLSVFFEGQWLTIDLNSLQGSMLLTDSEGQIQVVIAADAYLPNGALYSRTFVIQLSPPFVAF